jgi:hypothetical protein
MNSLAFGLLMVVLSFQAWADPKCEVFSSKRVCVGDQIPIAVMSGVYEGIVVDIRTEKTAGEVSHLLYWKEVGDSSGEIQTSGFIGFNKGQVPGFPERTFNESFVNPKGVEDKFIAYSTLGSYYYVYFGDTKMVERVQKEDLDFRYFIGGRGFPVQVSSSIFSESPNKPSKNLKEYRSEVEEVLLRRCQSLYARDQFKKSSSARIENVKIKFNNPKTKFKIFEIGGECGFGVSGPHYHIQVDYQATADCLAR